MTASTVQLRLQIVGQDALQQMQRLNLQQQQAQQRQTQGASQILRIQHQVNSSVQQASRYSQQQLRTNQSQVQTNRILTQMLQQQHRHTSLITQQLRQQQRDYQLQLNTLRQQVAASDRLRQNLQQAGQAQRNNAATTGSGGGWGAKAAAVGGAVIGAASVLQEPIQRTVNYDRDLHYASQKLSNKSEDWKLIKGWMNSTVVDDAKKGGVNRDQSFLAMDALIATGAYNDDSLEKMKGNLAKAHFEAAKSALASGGDILDFANVGTAAKRRGLDESKAQAMVIKADDLGAMSAKDLAKVLPAQLGALPADKVNGERQFAQLVALNEVAMNTAGNADEAANNVKNLLSKMYSDDTNKRLKKEYKIDLPKLYAKGKDTGKTDFDVLNRVVDSILAKDQNAKSLVAKIKSAGDDKDKLNILKTQQGIFEQSGLAAILPDMQSLMALVAANRYGDNWEKMTNVAMTEGVQTRDLKYQYNQKELASYGFNAADVVRKDGEFQTLQSTVQQIGKMGVKLSELTDQYPPLTKAMGIAELALKTLAVAGAGAAIGGFLGRGGAGTAAAGAGGAAAAAGGGALATAGQFALAGGLGYGAGTFARNIYMTTETGQAADNWIGEKITQTLALFGNDEAQATLEANAKYEQMISEQQQQNQISKDLSNKLSTLINVTQQNKPVINLGGGSLMDQISQHTRSEEKRHGVDLLSYGQK